MATYIVVEEVGGAGDLPRQHGPFAGLEVAKAVARKQAELTLLPTFVRDTETAEVVFRVESPSRPPAAPSEPSLAHSVRRLRAANDELMKALAPLGDRKKKGG